MTKINSELFAKIKEKYSSNKNMYASIKLEISKIFFALMASLYFLFYLSTIAGFQIELFSKLLYSIYPIFVFSILTLIYDMLIYGTSIYYKSYTNAIKIPLISVLVILFLGLMAVFLGLKFN